MKVDMTTGDAASRGEDRRYTEVADLTIRASVIAHAIRLGKRLPVGVEISFSQEIREGFADEALSPTGEIDVTKTKPITEKRWLRFNVTQADIDAAHELINSQKIKYRETGGKVSQMMTDSPADG